MTMPNMDGVIPYVIVNALGVATFAVAFALAMRGRRWALLAAGLAVGLLVFKGVITHLPVWEATLFPFASYIYLQSYWSPLIGLAFFGLAIPQLPVMWNRWVIAAVAAGVLVFGAQRTWWMVSRPSVGEDRYPDTAHHLEQSTGYTCAPCAAASAMSYLGQPYTERAMADLCLTVEEEGTTAFNTYRGLLMACADTAWRPRMRYLSVPELCTPGCIAVIDFPAIRHAITTVGLGDGVTLHDPLAGEPRHLSPALLAKQYGGTAIVFERR
jgi:hypothetical protein